jgi:hypothetical protein
MKSLFHHDFSLYMMPLRNLHPQWKKQYSSALDCWTRVWKPIHEHFHVHGPMNIDGFLRQDEGMFLFYKGKCMSLLLFRVMDFGILDFSLDSYFKDWPEEALDKMLHLGKRVFLCNNLTVDPAYRNYHPQLKFKQFCMNIMIRRFQQTNSDLMINMSRRDRGVNDEGFKRGGHLLASDVLIYDGQEHVDLVYFTRKAVKESRDSLVLSNFTDHLWDSRHDWLQPDVLRPTKQADAYSNQYPKAKPRKKVRVSRAS